MSNALKCCNIIIHGNRGKSINGGGSERVLCKKLLVLHTSIPRHHLPARSARSRERRLCGGGLCDGACFNPITYRPIAAAASVIVPTPAPHDTRISLLGRSANAEEERPKSVRQSVSTQVTEWTQAEAFPQRRFSACGVGLPTHATQVTKHGVRDDGGSAHPQGTSSTDSASLA